MSRIIHYAAVGIQEKGKVFDMMIWEAPWWIGYRALACGAENSVHPAANGYSTLFRTGEGLGGERSGDAVPIETSGTLTFTAPTYDHPAMRLTFTFWYDTWLSLGILMPI